MSHHQYNGSVSSDAPPCPDPSVHEKSNKLSEAASTAALLAANPDRKSESRSENPLDADGKLSSKSAAASLKYAKAQDLPSFPSTGGTTADSAGKAAMLAKDFKMKELWQPEISAAGSKAALLAAEKGSKLDLWQPSASADGNSAATIAMRNKSLSPQPYTGNSADAKSKALLAATMSVSRANRARAESNSEAPAHPAYPDSHNSAANALSAATQSHRTSTMKSAAVNDGWDSQAMQAARVQNLHMDPAMFTEHPPVEPELEEQRHNAALRASAITMAKQLYEQQNRAGAGEGSSEAGASRSAGGAATSTDIKSEALRYIHLQDAAHRLAAERLAKIDKNFENAKYREHYGYGGGDNKSSGSKRLSTRLSVRNALGRGRAGSETAGGDPDDSDDDEQQARRIRSQMSQLNSGLNAVDAKKQADDRARVMAAAEARVSAQMHELDERVFLETGKIPPAMLEEWEEKSRQAALRDREERARVGPNKTHIGGGKYMDQSEIEAIALARLKPTFAEINETAEKKRARDEELRQEKELQERIKQSEKEKNKAQKEEFKKIRSDDKAAAKQEKEEAKARKEEEKRLAKEEKRKSKHEAKDVALAGAAGATLGEVAEKVKNDDDQEQEDATKPRMGLFGTLRGRRNTREEARPKSEVNTKDAAAASAAGATLGEVAEKVKHDQEEKEDETPVVAAAATVPAAEETEDSKKHRSLFGGKTSSTKHEQDEPSTETEEAKKHRSLFGSKSDKHEAKEAAAAGAAAATLAEVAQKIKESDEAEGTAAGDEGVNKHRSALTRLKEKFRKDKDHEDAGAVEETPADSKAAEHHNDAVIASGVVGGAAAGAVAADAVHNDEKPAEATKTVETPVVAAAPVTSEPTTTSGAPVASAPYDADEKSPEEEARERTAAQKDAAPTMEFINIVPVEQAPIMTEASAVSEPEPAAAVEPAETSKTIPEPLPVVEEPENDDKLPEEKPNAVPFEQHGDLSRSANDGAAGLVVARPEIERHISQIPESDDDDDDEEEDEEADEKQDVAVAPQPVPVPQSPKPQTALGKVSQSVTDGMASVASGFAPVRPAHDTQAAEEDDREAYKRTHEATEKAGKVIADSFAPVAVAASSAPVAPVREAVPAKEESTAAAAPTVSSKDTPGDAKTHRAGSLTAPSVATPATAYIERTSRDVQDRPEVDETEGEDTDKKGLRGFFSKLKPKHKETPAKLPDFKTVSQKDKEAAAAKDKSERKAEKSTAPVAAAALGAGAGVTAAEVAHSEKPSVETVNTNGGKSQPNNLTTWAEPAPLHVGTDGPIGDSTKVSGIDGNPEAVPIINASGPMSATATALASNAEHPEVSDADDDEEKEGVASRLAAKLGLKSKKDQNKLHKRALDDKRQSFTETEDEDQQFEEARDHFDESAAPTPIVEKKTLEGKGTKFTENL